MTSKNIKDALRMPKTYANEGDDEASPIVAIEEAFLIRL